MTQTLTQSVLPADVAPDSRPQDEPARRAALYRRHAARNTVPPGDLRTDFSARRMLRALQVVLAKPTLSRKRLPIRLPLDEFRCAGSRPDRRTTDMVSTLRESAPLTSRSLRLIQLHDAVLCYAVHHVDIPYDDFVERVDISRVGDCFRDVLGITTAVIHRNAAGRPVMQLERIAALAQPNVAAFFGKDELDVYRLEHLHYGPDEERNWMRTVCSPNGSTSSGDVYLAFSREAGGLRTRIEFVARESAPGPRVLEFVRLHHWHWFHNHLTTRTYRRFWNDTLINIMARYEGREFGIDRPGRDRRFGLVRPLMLAAAVSGGAYFRSKTHSPQQSR